MAKNILIITGSPRKGGNSDLMAEAFAKGARGAGATVNVFNAAADPVKPCTACDACWKKGKPCVFDDGFDRLGPMLEQADTVVLCGPLYWYTFSAQLRSATDKFYAYMSENAPRKLKWSGMALMMCAADTDPAAFAGPVATYRSVLGFVELADRGQLLITDVMEKGAIHKTDALARAGKLGADLA